MIGKTIGQYQVIDKIGEGGMGAVYKAEDTTLHRLVALKTLSSHLTEDKEALDDPYLQGNHTFWRGCIAALRGEKEEAVIFVRESFEQGIGYDRPQTDMDLEPLHDFPAYIELMRPKG